MTTTSRSEPRIRVTRTLVYEGVESWVAHTLANSFIKTTPLVVGSGSIVETARSQETIAEQPDARD